MKRGREKGRASLIKRFPSSPPLSKKKEAGTRLACCSLYPAHKTTRSRPARPISQRSHVFGLSATRHLWNYTVLANI